MKDLIEALTIFLKYKNDDYPTHCYNEIFNVDIDASLVSLDDVRRLEELSFYIDEDDNTFSSARFGSC